jgi:hypothetical protein
MILIIALIAFLMVSIIADEINWDDWVYWLMHEEKE